MDNKRRAFIEKLRRLDDSQLSKVEGWLAMNKALKEGGAMAAEAPADTGVPAGAVRGAGGEAHPAPIRRQRPSRMQSAPTRKRVRVRGYAQKGRVRVVVKVDAAVA